MRKYRTFAGKPFQDMKRLILMIWLLNSEGFKQNLEARKNIVLVHESRMSFFKVCFRKLVCISFLFL